MVARKIAFLVVLSCPAMLTAQKAPTPAVAGQIKPAPAAAVQHSPSTTGSQNTGKPSGFLASNAGTMRPPTASPARPASIARSARAIVMPLQRQYAYSSQQNAQIAAPVPVSLPVAEPALSALGPMPKANPEGQVEVDFRQGKLTVVATNAELGKVLRMIAAKTGADIQVAQEVAAEPVVVRLGPGPSEEVLGALLSSPRIDFIILGADQQGRLQRVLVRQRASFGREPVLTSKTAQKQTEHLEALDVEPQPDTLPQVDNQPQGPAQSAPPL